ncbi:MAG: hypothetical protein ABGX38_03350 [Thermoleophilia bacterium]
MGARAKAIFPLALVIGVLSYLWTEFSLNFTFHWVTVAGTDAPGAVGVPQNFHFILPTAFISWGLFFAAGGDNAAFGKIFLASVFGTVAALVTIPLSYQTAGFPDFWGIALWVGIFAFILVMILVAGDWYYVAGTFPAFAAVFLWWVATGMDGWAPVGSEADAGAGTAAGATGLGAFAGLISTPWAWVWFNTLVTLIVGVILGIVSGKLAALLTPKPKEA